MAALRTSELNYSSPLGQIPNYTTPNFLSYEPPFLVAPNSELHYSELLFRAPQTSM
jgi:hypothetical protein